MSPQAQLDFDLYLTFCEETDRGERSGELITIVSLNARRAHPQMTPSTRRRHTRTYFELRFTRPDATIRIRQQSAARICHPINPTHTLVRLICCCSNPLRSVTATNRPHFPHPRQSVHRPPAVLGALWLRRP